MASTSRMLARNWLPRPSPFEAPRTSPAMSTKEMRVGMISFDPATSAIFFSYGVRHRDLAGVRLDGAEGIVGGLRGSRARKRVEKRRLANVGQPNDAAFETHESIFLREEIDCWRGYGRLRRSPSSPGLLLTEELLRDGCHRTGYMCSLRPFCG